MLSHYLNYIYILNIQSGHIALQLCGWEHAFVWPAHKSLHSLCLWIILFSFATLKANSSPWVSGGFGCFSSLLLLRCFQAPRWTSFCYKFLPVERDVFLPTVAKSVPIVGHLIVGIFSNIIGSYDNIKSRLLLFWIGAIQMHNFPYLSSQYSFSFFPPSQQWLGCCTPASTAVWVNHTSSSGNGLAWCAAWLCLWVSTTPVLYP